MKTRTIIEELTQEDLVNLLCTATYGSNWLGIWAPDQDDAGINRDDCEEDRWAKVLLAGKKIRCTDYYAESCVYGENEDFNICEDGDVEYNISLQDIINGLQKCVDGTFFDAYSGKGFIAKCYNDFANDGDGWDTIEADALMQIILFSELIYG